MSKKPEQNATPEKTPRKQISTVLQGDALTDFEDFKRSLSVEVADAVAARKLIVDRLNSLKAA